MSCSKMLKDKLNFYPNTDDVMIKNLTIRDVMKDDVKIGFDCIVFYYDSSVKDYFCEFAGHFFNNSESMLEEIKECCRLESIPIKLEETTF